MHDTKTLRRHAGLVDRMAGTLGIDLEEAAMRGEMQMDEIADAVLLCTGCAAPEVCDRWMADQKTVVSQGPDYCRNKRMFDRLRLQAEV